MKRNKSNLTSKISIRLEDPMRDWVMRKGGSDFIRDLLNLAHFNLEGKECLKEEGNLLDYWK